MSAVYSERLVKLAARSFFPSLLLAWLASLVVWLPNRHFASAFAATQQNQVATTFTLTGFIRNQGNQPVSGVRVSLLDENSMSIYSGFNESNGRFTVKNIRQGRYIIRVETTGSPYEEYSQVLDLQSLRMFGGNEIVPVDIILRYKKEGESVHGGSVFAQNIPKAARTEFERGVTNLKGKKVEAAIAFFKKALEVFPDYFDALELLGIEYVKSNQHEAALPVLTHAIELNKRAARSLYALGVAHLRLNQLSQAIEALEKSVQINSSNPNAEMMLGLALGNSGLPERAEAAFRKALQLGGEDAAEAHYYLAGLYNKQTRYREAWKELETFLRESKNVKEPAQIKAMIANLKEKEKAHLATAGEPAAASSPAPSNNPPAIQSAPLPTSNPNEVSSGAVGPAGENASALAAPDAVNPPPLVAAETFGTVPPLPPEYIELLQQTQASGVALHKQLLDYTYQLKKTHHVLNNRGTSTQSQEQVFEAYPIRGEHVLILLSHDGRPSRDVSEERKRAAKQLEEATRQPASDVPQDQSGERPASGYVSAGVRGTYQGRAGYISIDLSVILQSCEFFSPRLETIGDREMVILNYRHRAGVKLDHRHNYIAALTGTVWIDRADKVLARLEGWPLTAAAFDLVQSTAPRSDAALIYQQTRQPDGAWFPSEIRMNAGGRTDLFNGLNWEVIFEFSNYQRFNTSASEKMGEPQKSRP